MPTIRGWADAGHRPLREITRADIVAALPGSGSPRATLGTSLRSIFRVLKGRKVIFVNPTARISTGEAESRQPLPVELAPLRNALDSTNSATAALTAPIAFHGLRADGLRRLQLTDVRDGRLRLTLGRSPRSLREDRTLDEDIATGGDIRRLTDLFGLSVNAATRYAAGIGHLDLHAD